MESQEFTKSICRICLDENASVDWNTTLYQYYNMTYKDCYYRYTQLKYFDEDHFSQMLCQDCSNGLHNTHALVSKALESHKFFQDEFGINIIQLDDEIKYTPTEFETVLVEKIEVEPTIDDCFEYEESDEEFISIAPVASKTGRRTKKSLMLETQGKVNSETLKNSRSEDKIEKCSNEPLNKSPKVFDELNTPYIKSKRKNISRVKTIKSADLDVNNIKTESIEDQNTEEQKTIDLNLISNELMDSNKRKEDCGRKSKPKVKKKYKGDKRMCSICSKILHGKNSVQMHEKTHIENRERKETCTVCGLKYYDKGSLYCHMLIHNENREKIHKCEFCSKSFYNRGGLNIHRRIHLGQMIPCSLCSKQYVRQVDLDRHMSTHSATIKNSDTKKRSRYFVRCEHCDKSILSTSFKSHTAAHLNEPLMKCSICGKEFFRRGSCVLHVKKVHQKTNEEYNDFIILYKKNRISHLFLEQKAEIQVNYDE